MPRAYYGSRFSPRRSSRSPRFPLWRVVLAVGIGAFIFYSYDEFKELQKDFNFDPGDWLPLLWIPVSVAAALAALALLRRPEAVAIVLIFSLVLAAPTLARLLATAPNKHGVPLPSDDHMSI